MQIWRYVEKIVSAVLTVAMIFNIGAFVFFLGIPTTKAANYVTPAFISVTSDEAATTDGLITVNGPVDVQPGDLLVACATTDQDSDGLTTRTFGWPAGFSAVANEKNVSGDDIGALVAYRIADENDPNPAGYDFGYEDNGADFSVVMAAFRGIDSIDPFDATTTSITDAAGWDDTTDANPSVTTTNDNALVVLCAHHTQGNISDYSPPSGTTNVQDRISSGENTGMAFFVQSSAGSTGSKQFTTTGEGGGEEWILTTTAFNAESIVNVKTKKEYSEATSTTWTVPDNVYEIEVKVWGAGGGGGGADNSPGGAVGGYGGGGAFVYGRVTVTPGETLGIEVGGGGGEGWLNTNGGEGGGGGGHTEITRSGNPLLIAGAGGGGGGSSEGTSEDGGDGGAGGADTGETGDTENGGATSLGGNGGTQLAGGTGGNGNDGASQAGGDGQGGTSACGDTFGWGGFGGLAGSTSGGDGGPLYNAGQCGGAGGGGSGYYGGEGGESDGSSHAGGGGGGGSSWASSTAVANAVKLGGAGKTMANATDPDLRASGNSVAGLGGSGTYRYGNDGYDYAGDGDEGGQDGQDGMLIIKYRALGEVSGQTTLTSNVFITGDALVNNQLSKSSGTFVIDHPLDPENKLLYHSFVESPEAKNIYDGVTKLNWRGEATVKLPDYFEALNIDYRYQYTPIGEPMPDLYIKKTINRNRFTIAGGRPGGEVTWQVTGVRNDPYIQANPIIPVVEKGPDELVDKGEYLFSGYEEIINE